MISFTPKTTNYERVPTQTSISTWNVSHIISDSYTWTFSAYATSNYNLMFIKNGTFEFSSMHKTEALGESTSLCIAPGQTFFIRATQETKSELYIVEFDCTNFAFFPLTNYLISSLNKSDEALFYNLENSYMSHQSDYIVDSYLIQLLYYISTHLDNKENQTELVIKIREYIQKHVHEHLTVSKVASAFNYNKDYLSRTLQKSHNISIKDMIVEEKLRIAKNLLIFTDYPIVKIGNQIGFDNPNEFHKFFKYHVKLTPANYRISRMR